MFEGHMLRDFGTQEHPLRVGLIGQIDERARPAEDAFVWHGERRGEAGLTQLSEKIGREHDSTVRQLLGHAALGTNSRVELVPRARTISVRSATGTGGLGALVFARLVAEVGLDQSGIDGASRELPDACVGGDRHLAGGSHGGDEAVADDDRPLLHHLAWSENQSRAGQRMDAWELSSGVGGRRAGGRGDRQDEGGHNQNNCESLPRGQHVWLRTRKTCSVRRGGLTGSAGTRKLD